MKKSGTFQGNNHYNIYGEFTLVVRCGILTSVGDLVQEILSHAPGDRSRNVETIHVGEATLIIHG